MWQRGHKEEDMVKHRFAPKRYASASTTYLRDKHTAGPWEAAYSDDCPGGSIRSDHHADGPGALLLNAGPMFHNYTPNREEELANLHLAAAAPELLAALQEYDDFSKANDDWSDMADEMEADLPVPNFVTAARAAIARAKGGRND
jgi:hypothetical protein